MAKYEYTYVTAKTDGFFRTSDYKEIINKMAKQGWRFVNSIPSYQNGNGITIEIDLVFEREADEFE